MVYWSDRNRQARLSPLAQSALFFWLDLRMAGLFLLTAVLGVAVRIPFALMQIIPRHLDFDPGVVVFPAAGVFFGPAGAWGSFAASLLSDLLLGRFQAVSVFRAAGAFFFALGTQVLWQALRGTRGRSAPATWRRAGLFVLLSLPGAVTAAAWNGLGSEVLKLYPFGYIALVSAGNNLLFCVLLGAPLYWLLALEWAKRFGTWREMVKDPPPPMSAAGAAAVAASGAVAMAAGMYVGSAFYHVSPLRAALLGSHAGAGAAVVVGLVLAAQAWTIFRS